MIMRNLLPALLLILLAKLSLQQCKQNEKCITCKDSTRCEIPNIEYFITFQGIARYHHVNCIRQIVTFHSSICVQCKDGYSPDGYGCTKCTGFYCKTCNTQTGSTHQCLTCPVGRYLEMGDCKTCNINNCYQCSNINTCPPCSSQIEGFSYSFSKCLQCSFASCKNCSLSPIICSQCKFGFGLVGTACHFCPDKCKICNDSTLSCLKCYQGYGLSSNNSCVPCPADCSICNISTICLFCVAGKGISSGSCIPCQGNNCIECLEPNICLRCKPYFGLSSAGLCEPCAPFCSMCDYNSSYCYQCGTQSTLVRFAFDGFCLLNCYYHNCVKCGDYFKCEKCDPNQKIGLSFRSAPNLIYCQYCDQQNCTNCSTNYLLCQQCQGRQGPMNGICVFCSQTECLNCSLDANACQFCADRTYLQNGNCLGCPFACARCNATYCFECVDANNRKQPSFNGICHKPCYYQGCLQCSSNYYVCGLCNATMPKFGLNQKQGGDVSCSYCSQQNCTQCAADVAKCTKCTGRQGPNSSFICQFCQKQNCVDCSISSSKCEVCAEGYFLQPNQFCNVCPRQCNTCYYDLSASQVQCITCSKQFLMNNTKCQDLCGDSTTISLECDNQFDVSFDGCNDQCQQMTNFTCITTPEQKSICSYNKPISFEFVSFSDTQTINEFVLTLKVWPPLHIFSLASDSQIINSFKISNKEFSLSSARYDSKSQHFIFTLKLNSVISSSSFQIKFTPSKDILKEYLYTPEATFSKNFDFSAIAYYSQMVVSLMKAFEYVCWIIVICSWISVLMGIINRNLFGLEAMFTVQFVWLTFLWTQVPNLFLFSSFIPLKYSTGYNYNKTVLQNKSENQISTEPPFTSQFGISKSNFINNFNFSFFMLIFFTVLSLILYCYLKYCQRVSRREKANEQATQTQKNNTILQQNETQKWNNSTKETNENLEKKVEKITNKYQFTLQILLSTCLLSLINFLNSSVILFTSNSNISAPCLITFVVSLSILLLVILKFYFEPDPFSYFRYSFKQTLLSLNHFYIYIIALFSVTLLLILFTSLPYLPLPILGLMILYTLKQRPYLELKNSLRSAFNFFVVFLFAIFKVYSQNISKSKLTQYPSISILVISTFLLLTVVLLSIYFQIICFLTNCESKNSLKSVIQNEDQINIEILNNLVKADVHKKMKQINHQNFFKEFVSPKKSLLTLSNELQQKEQSINQNENNETKEKRKKNENQCFIKAMNCYENTQKCVQNNSEIIIPKQISQKQKLKAVTQQIIKHQNSFIKYKATEKHTKTTNINQTYINYYNKI